MIPLIMYIGYGNEHPIFPRARNLWAIYRELFSEVRIVFVKSSLDVDQDDYIYLNGEYTFGRESVIEHDRLPGMAVHDAQGYLVDRSLKLFKRILSDYREPFWLYSATVTSAIDPRVLRYLVDCIECKSVFAGPPLFSRIPDGLAPDMPAGKIFRMISGAGTLFSSDMIRLLVEREHLVNHDMLVDVWISLVLRDIPRIPMMRSDILDVRHFNGEVRESLKSRIEKDIQDGHFAFRVKSGRWEEKSEIAHCPEDVDILVLNDIMLHLLSQSPSQEKAFVAWERYRRAMSDIDGFAMAPIAE